MEDWITVDEEVVDQIPCVCGKGMQYKVRLLDVDSISGTRRNQTIVRIECSDSSCSSNKK